MLRMPFLKFLHSSCLIKKAKFYTAQGSEYIVTEDGQSRRIKSKHGLAVSQEPDVSGVVAGRLLAERSPGPGVHVRELWSEGVKRALEIEFEPGAQWPGLDHHVPGPEEVYILSGDFDDGTNVYRAGTFLHHPAGSSHSPKTVEGSMCPSGRLMVVPTTHR